MTVHRILFSFLLFSFYFQSMQAQPERWQQRVDYKMDIDMDAAAHRFTGHQTLKYFNNSPDTLGRVFYHLYFNAFQPGSMMDWENRNPQTADSRVRDRISKLKEDEMGWHHIKSLTCNGQPVNFETVETTLEVTLPEPILPHSTAVFEMEFESQVPIQIRRSGRDSRDGIAYSMTQWYPKMAEYDYQGWHADPYVGREFYGVWGDFDVHISIDKKYVLGASGILQNPGEIGYGYEKEGTAVHRPGGGKLDWHWKAENVHDFAWTADPEYKHLKVERKDGLTLHFLYQETEQTKTTWQAMPAVMDKAFDFINAHFGQYAYKSYSFLNGGDGGMEYPMATLLASRSGVGTFTHELMHAWFYGMLGSNESLHPWMDEGFTEFATAEVLNHLRAEQIIPGQAAENPHIRNNLGYISFARAGREEPLSTHHDHYLSTGAGGMGAYTKGHVVLTQLQYIMGKPVFENAMRRYFNTWKFKHPNPNDFIRIMERESGLELDWYKEYFIFTTKTIDYAVDAVEKANRKQTRIVLRKIGHMPMPIDLVVTYKNGKKEMLNIPLVMMRGAKPPEKPDMKYTVLKDWGWTIPTYEFLLDAKFKDIVSVEIDPSQRMAGVVRSNNLWEPEGKK
ncbi:MAG: M1 family metallopeptidase [Saprospiraceae bacterium]